MQCFLYVAVQHLSKLDSKIRKLTSVNGFEEGLKIFSWQIIITDAAYFMQILTHVGVLMWQCTQ